MFCEWKDSFNICVYNNQAFLVVKAA